MNNLLELYDTTSNFAERHRMISEFGVLGSEEEIGSVEFEYRSMQLVVSSSNISRELNRPTYTIDFSLIVMDKTVAGDARARLLSSEENIFVIGQYQDYLLQKDQDVEFNDVEIVSIDDEDYVITVAYCDFSVNFSRKGYTNSIAEPVAPSVINPPTFSGVEEIGETLTAIEASTSGIPLPLTTWQWQISDDGETEWSDISGETSSEYVIIADDGNKYLRVAQTETNSEGSDTDYSSPTQQIPAAPEITGVPTIAGTPEVGEDLTATAAEVTGTPEPTTTWQWQVSDDGETGWADIEGETSDIYTLLPADDLKYVRVVQTETNDEGSDVAESLSTAQITTP